MTQFDSLMEHHTRDRARRALHRPDAVEGPYHGEPPSEGGWIWFVLAVVCAAVSVGYALGKLL